MNEDNDDHGVKVLELPAEVAKLDVELLLKEDVRRWSLVKPWWGRICCIGSASSSASVCLLVLLLVLCAIDHAS